VPSFRTRKRPVDRDQQPIVITSIEVETFNTDFMNKVTRAQGSFPQDNIDARTQTRRGTVMGVKVDAGIVDRVHDFKSKIK
jgi:L-arabinose isomerase